MSERRAGLDAQGLPVPPFRHLVLMKFQAGRVQDSEDLVDSVRELFGQLLPEGRDDLESLITLGQLEMRPPHG